MGRQAEMADGRGRHAERPRELPAKGWKDILMRVWREIGDDRVSLVAAGTAFYILLAIFPAMAALVSIYGLLADPATLEQQLDMMAGVMPASTMDLMREQLHSVVTQDQGGLGFAFLFGLALSLWSANNGIKTLFEAMNVAYDETEKRGFVSLTLHSLGFTLGALLFVVLLVIAMGVIPVMLQGLGLGATGEALLSILRWPVLAVIIITGIALLYRYGPSRDQAKWRWITWGSVIATVIWLVGSLLFSWYLQNFADYNATYGSLGAVIGLMMWLWISCYIVIVGGELNSEMEHQTAQDTTVGEDEPMGERGAVMADNVGEPAGKS